VRKFMSYVLMNRRVPDLMLNWGPAMRITWDTLRQVSEKGVIINTTWTGDIPIPHRS